MLSKNKQRPMYAHKIWLSLCIDTHNKLRLIWFLGFRPRAFILIHRTGVQLDICSVRSLVLTSSGLISLTHTRATGQEVCFVPTLVA